MVRGARDILQQDEVEHVARDWNIELADNHTRDVGSKKDTGEKKDAHKVP